MANPIVTVIDNQQNDPVADPKESLLTGFSQYFYTKTTKQINPILVGDWTPIDDETWTVQCVSSSIVKIDRSGGYNAFVLLLRSIKMNDEQPSDSVFNTIFNNLNTDKFIDYGGHTFWYIDGNFNSPVRVSGGGGIDGYYDSGLLESENTLTTSAILTFYAYE